MLFTWMFVHFGAVLVYVVAIVQHTNSTVLQTHRVMGQEQVGAREMRERKRTEPIWISHTSMIPSPTTFDESDRTLRVYFICSNQ